MVHFIQLCQWVSCAGENGLVALLDDGGSGIEGGDASCIAELSDRDEGVVDVVENLGGSGFGREWQGEMAFGCVLDSFACGQLYLYWVGVWLFIGEHVVTWFGAVAGAASVDDFGCF